MGQTGRFYEALWDERDREVELKEKLAKALGDSKDQLTHFSDEVRSMISNLIDQADSVYRLFWAENKESLRQPTPEALEITDEFVSFLLRRDCSKWMI